MIQISAELLALSNEPALLSRMGKVIFANSAARRLLGGDCVGLPLHSVLSPEAAAIQAPSFVGDGEVGGKRYLLRVCSADGVRAWFLSPAERADSYINDAFLFFLRSRLMDMNVAITLLRTRLEAEDASALLEQADSLTHSFYRLNRVLANATVVHALAANDLYFLPEPTDLAVLVRELTEQLRPYYPDIVFQVRAPASLAASADAELLRQLVLNLVSNSICHAQGCRHITLTLHDAGDKILLSVTDDGAGIPGDEMSGVFERYRSRPALSDVGRGIGLGLTAVREIARLHGGTVLLESREDAGTSVRVSLSVSPQPVLPVHERELAYTPGMNPLLTGLADCLPDDCFSARYMD